MLGSTASVANPNTILNTAVAEVLSQFYDELSGASDIEKAVHELVKKTFKNHKRIIFNGNGYTDEWVKEATKRGLYNLPSTPDCLPQFIAEKNIDLFTKHHIFTKEEIFSRYDILLENYSKTIQIEALTALDMARKDILPAIERYSDELARSAADKRALNISCAYETKTCAALSDIMSGLSDEVARLDVLIDSVPRDDTALKCALFFRNQILPAMNSIRALADKAELMTARDHWPYPSMGEMMFSEE